MQGGKRIGAPPALQQLRGFAFDLDGTIWAGPHLLPGAVELVEDLRGSRIKVIFASNSSRHGSLLLANRLTEMGIAASEAEVVTAFDLVGEEILRRLGRVRVMPLGTRDLADLLTAAGHDVVAIADWKRAQAVVIGNDPAFDFDRLRAASRTVAAGAMFFAVNMDARFPVAEDAFDPGCGSPGRSDRRGFGREAGGHREAVSSLVRGRHRATAMQTGRSGDGRRQPPLGHRRRQGRWDAHRLDRGTQRCACPRGSRPPGQGPARAAPALAKPANGHSKRIEPRLIAGM